MPDRRYDGARRDRLDAMVIAALRDNAYDVVLLLHIISIVIAFAPAVVNPLTEARLKADGAGEGGLVAFYKAAGANGRRVYFPALIVAGVFGGALIGMSKTNDELVWKFDQTWVWLSILNWVVMCGVVSAVILPNERKVAGGDVSAASKVAAGGGIATLLVIVQLYLMIFKPGV
jgi:hypothetical protein